MRRILAVLCLLVANIPASPALARQEVEPTFRITGSTPAPIGHVAGAPTPVVFAIYDVDTGGTPLWQETQLLPLGPGGEYSAVLGAGGPGGVPVEVFASGGPRWLSVQAAIGGAGEPARTRLTSVPYALRAATAGNADTLGGLPASAFLRSSGTGAGAMAAVARRGAGLAPAPLVNSGTAGYLGKFVNGVDLGNSVLFENAGSLGLGTTTPLATLHVNGNSTGGVAVGVQNTGTSFGSTSGYVFYDALGAVAASARFSNSLKVWMFNNAASGGTYDFSLGTASRLRIGADGHIGVGVTAPAYMLDIADDGTGTRVKGGVATVRIESNGADALPSGINARLEMAYIRVPSNATSIWRLVNENSFWIEHGTTKVLSIDTTNHALTIPSGTGDRLVAQGNIRVGTGSTGCVKDADGTVIAGTCSSDLRFKRDVAPFGPALDRFVQLTPVHYFWRADEFADRQFGARQSWGLIAQDVAPLFPDLVTTDDDGYLAVNYSKLPLYTMQAVKELKAENDRLKAQNDALAARLDALEVAMRRR